VDADIAIRNIRLIAIDRLVGREVSSDELIQAGLDALLAGVNAPSLSVLAGLTRREEPEARELFDRVVDELDLGPRDLPDDLAAREWALLRWFAQLIVDGALDAKTGGKLIWWNSDHVPADCVDMLRPLRTSIALYDDEISRWAIWDSDYVARNRVRAAEVVHEAAAFVGRSRPT
jgi:hypothetical protein